MNNYNNGKQSNRQSQGTSRRVQTGSNISARRTLHTEKSRSAKSVATAATQRRNRPAEKKGSLGRLVTVWVAVLAVLLLIIMIIAMSGRDNASSSDNGTPVFAAEGDGRETAPENTGDTETYSVEYAVRTDATAAFSSNRTFANGILIDLENGTVIADRGGDERIYPASMTKIMTLIVAVEKAKSLDETFTMTAEITDPLYLENASVAGFSVGEKVSVRDLIYGLILPSGGDGALGLAYHIAGGEEAFAELMNAKAKELGLKNTHFTNCTGLHDNDHYSTCHEIGLILEYAIRNDFMREVLTTYRYTTASTAEHPDGIELTSTLLSRMNGDDSGTFFVQGGKTGYTTEAKNCLASFATELVKGMSEDSLKQQPTRYILVTAGSPDKWDPVFDAIEIYKGLGAYGASADSAETTVAVPDTKKSTVSEKDTASDKSSDTRTSATSKPVGESIKIYTAAAPS